LGQPTSPVMARNGAGGATSTGRELAPSVLASTSAAWRSSSSSSASSGSTRRGGAIAAGDRVPSQESALDPAAPGRRIGGPPSCTGEPLPIRGRRACARSLLPPPFRESIPPFSLAFPRPESAPLYEREPRHTGGGVGCGIECLFSLAVRGMGLGQEA
jgi:hypothetical protein